MQERMNTNCALANICIISIQYNELKTDVLNCNVNCTFSLFFSSSSFWFCGMLLLQVFLLCDGLNNAMADVVPATIEQVFILSVL